MELIKHIKRWNRWRKYNTNSKLHKLLVLLGIIKSPTMVFWFPVDEWEDLCIIEKEEL